MLWVIDDHVWNIQNTQIHLAAIAVDFFNSLPHKFKLLFFRLSSNLLKLPDPAANLALKIERYKEYRIVEGARRYDIQGGGSARARKKTQVL
jgi:hypothetical protein